MGKKSKQSHRPSISMDSEIESLRTIFEQVVDNRSKNASHKLSDILMSGFAMFSLKYKSLLSFEHQTAIEKANLQTIYGIEKVCSDVQLRSVLDTIDPSFIRSLFPEKFKTLHKTGILADFSFKIGGTSYLIMSCDGVQHFSSKSIKCKCCLSKTHKDGSVTYHHNMLCAALVHPEKREVFLIDVEPIVQQDGKDKQDCERNAAKRLQENVSKAYQKYEKQYNFLFVEDALYANAPHIETLTSNGYHYILNVKPDSHKTLFAYIEGKRQRKSLKTYAFAEKKGKNTIKHDFEYVNNVLLCNSSPTTRVNFVSYTQTITNDKGVITSKTTFTWITNIKIAENKLIDISKAGRARWKIENETFNTLKNLGYHFEHNYGHGDDHLATTFAFLMLLAFYIDQLVQSCCHIFQQIEKNIITKIKLWETQKAIFQTSHCISMEYLYRRIAWLFSIKIKHNLS
jgi:Transposase DDE domain